MITKFELAGMFYTGLYCLLMAELLWILYPAYAITMCICLFCGLVSLVAVTFFSKDDICQDQEKSVSQAQD